MRIFKGTAARGLRGMMASALLATTALGASAIIATPAMAQDTRSYDIRAGTLSVALSRFIEASGVAVVYDAPLAQNAASAGLKGSYGPAEALSRILAGSGLTYRQTGPRSFTLERAPTADAGVVQLGPVRVEGGSDTYASSSILPPAAAVTEGTQSYTTNAVTIGKTVLNTRDIPQSISVVTRQRIEDENFFTLTDALVDTPGITLISHGSGRSVFSARGFAIDTTMIDGLPTSQDDNQLLEPDLALYDRVEVLRGANGLLQGTGDPSASINLIRKRPTDELAISGAASIGSWNNYRAELDVGGPIDANGKLRARVVGSFQDNDYFYDVAHQRRWLISGIADFQLTPTTLITAGYTYMKSDARPDLAGLPRYSDGGDLHLPRSTYLGAIWNHYGIDNQEGFLELRQQIGTWSAQAIVRRSTASNDWKNIFVSGPVNRTTGTGARYFGSILPYGNKQTGGDLYLTGPVSLFGRSHTILLGATARKNYGIFSLADLASGPFGQPADLQNYNPRTVPELVSSGDFQFRFQQWTKQAGIYGSARLNLADPLTVILGGRISWWEYSQGYGEPALFTMPKTTTKKNNILTPYAGIVYKITPTISAYGSYARIFQPQTGIQFPGTVLPPVEGANYELGIKAGLLDERLNLTVAAFQIDQTNRPVADPDRPCLPADPICFKVPSGKVRSRGVETEITGNITDQLQIAAGYTYTDTKYLKDTSATGAPTANQGRSFNPYTPKHLVKLWANYTLPDSLSSWSIGGGIQAQSRVYTLTNNVRVTQGSYLLADVRIGYKINEHLTAAVTLNNIFDRRYYKTITTPTNGNFYGDPRNFMVSLRGKF